MHQVHDPKAQAMQQQCYGVRAPTLLSSQLLPYVFVMGSHSGLLGACKAAGALGQVRTPAPGTQLMVGAAALPAATDWHPAQGGCCSTACSLPTITAAQATPDAGTHTASQLHGCDAAVASHVAQGEAQPAASADAEGVHVDGHAVDGLAFHLQGALTSAWPRPAMEPCERLWHAEVRTAGSDKRVTQPG